AQTFLRHGVTDRNYNIVGKSFDAILEPVKSNLDEFRAYIKDKRALELEDRGIMTGSDLTRSERGQAIRQLERVHPEFVQAQRELLEYQDKVLNELIDSGVVGADD